MAEISKYMDVSIENLAKILGVDKDSLTNIVSGVGDIPPSYIAGDRGIFGHGRRSRSRASCLGHL